MERSTRPDMRVEDRRVGTRGPTRRAGGRRSGKWIFYVFTKNNNGRQRRAVLTLKHADKYIMHAKMYPHILYSLYVMG